MTKFFLFLLLAAGTAAKAQDTTLQEYAGRFKFPDGSVVADVTVLYANGALSITSTAGTTSLERIKADSFTIVNFNGAAVFKRNDNHKITGIHIDASGYVLDGEKDTTVSHGYAVMQLLQAATGEEMFKNIHLSTTPAGYIAGTERITKQFYRRDPLWR